MLKIETLKQLDKVGRYMAPTYISIHAKAAT